jgi:ParB/RepB/Spo0J family partition protein
MVKKKKDENSEVQFPLVLNETIRMWRDEQTIDKKLAASIKAEGLLEPILARKLESGQLEVFAGTRRFRALMSLGFTPKQLVESGDVRVKEHVSDVDAIVMALTENKDRKDLSPVEEGRAFKSLIDLKLKVKDIAEKTSTTESYVQERLNLLELPKEIQEKMNDGKMALGYAVSLLRLKGHPEGQKELFHEIQRGYGMNIERAGESAKEALAEVKKLEQIRKKYGPCPKCGSPDIDNADKWGHKRKLKCKKCGLEFDAVTKDPWAVFQIKEHAKKIGLDARITSDGKMDLAPEEVARVVQERTDAIKTIEEPSLGRSGLTPEQMLQPLIRNDNVSSITVENDEIKVHLLEHTGLFFAATRKEYRTGEKSTVRAIQGWREGGTIAARKPKVQTFLQEVEREVGESERAAKSASA